ncbi:MAG TPA: ABC transporter permease [Actinomycetota bacterium]|jgi:phospholipid/cholesterol/gamma-HCH transport system permease protein|nr:ABC transporter permease [Actinomycetota bacterium]
MFSIGLEALHTSFRRPWPLQEFLTQCWFLMKVTTLPVILISIPFGMIISLHVGSFLRDLGAEAHMGAAMVLAVVREAAPVATALLIAGVGGSAMCADLGSRRIRDEIDAMQVLGIDVVHRLIMPRIFAAALVAILLDAIVSIAGIAGGWFFAIVVHHGTTSSYFGSFNELSQLADLWMALIKAVIFGYVAGAVACYKGFFVRGGPKGVGDAVNQAVVITFIILFFLNFILTALYFNFVPQKL